MISLWDLLVLSDTRLKEHLLIANLLLIGVLDLMVPTLVYHGKLFFGKVMVRLSSYITSPYLPNNTGYSIGIGNSATVFKNLWMQSSTYPYAVVGTAYNNNNFAIAKWARYYFLPNIVPLAPTTLNFSNVTTSSLDLSWTDNATNETGYAIYNSTDGTNYSLVAQLPANSNTTSVSGLSGGTSYNWKVYAVKEFPSTALAGSQGTIATHVASNVKIGPTGDFPSIKSALNTLKGSGFPSIGGSIFELQAAYNSIGETFPINFNGLPTDASNPLIIRPETGATAFTITSNAAQTIILDGADYVSFDGKPGSVGTVQLKIDNTLISGNALFLQNAASNNTISYCEITGVTTGTTTTSGVVVIGTSVAALGNSNNIFEYCNIHDGTTKPTLLLVNSGTSGKLNQNNTISNCNFYNWNLATGTGNARALNSGNNQSRFQISGNSFYQTSPTGNITQATNGIINLYGDGTTFENNYIGGSGPGCSGTMELNYSSYYGKVFGIFVYAGISMATEIQGNFIQNIKLNIPSGSGGYFSGIEITSGVVNIGTNGGNTIGSETVSNSILINNIGSWSASGFVGINENNTGSAADKVTISNNIICGISYPNAPSFPITGISIYETNGNALPATVSNNIIGSSTLADAISSAGGGSIIGISGQTGAGSNVTGNTIANITKTNTGTTGQLIGIYSTSDNVVNNNIFDLTTASGVTAVGSTSGLIGISASGIPGTTISNNHIYGLSNTNTSAAATLTGIYNQSSTTGRAIVEKNMIHGLNLASANTSRNNRYLCVHRQNELSEQYDSFGY